MATFNWPGFGIRSVSWSFDQPAQVNSSGWSGKRTVVSNPWHGKWSAKVELATQQGDGAFQAARAFFTQLKGQVNTFHLPAVEAPQNSNSGVTLSSNAAQGATTIALVGVTTALVAGNMATIAGQLLSLTGVNALDVSTHTQTITFMPALRAAATAGDSIETAKPYALVALADSSFTWDIGSWRRYGLSFMVEEAVGETDGASPTGDTWNAVFSGTSGGGTSVGGVSVQQNGGVASNITTLNFTGGSLAVSGSTASYGPFVTPQQFYQPTDPDFQNAMEAARDYLKSVAGNAVNANYKASAELFMPAGSYPLHAQFDITHTFTMAGEGGMGLGGGSTGSGASTELVFPAGCIGVCVQALNTSAQTTVDGPHTSGAFSTLRDFAIRGPASGTDSISALSLTEGAYHGLDIKATTYLSGIFVEGFQGDALYSHTTAGGGVPDEGASNGSRAYNCWFRGSRNGVSLAGADSNVWVFDACQATYNRACGVDDQAFLTNTHTGWHTNGNGAYIDNQGTADFPCYVVSNGGNRYAPIQGQETTASTTAPSGTADTSVWYYLGAGGADSSNGVIAWVSGIHLRCAAPFRTPLTSSPAVFVNPYAEGNQGPAQFGDATTIIAGTWGGATAPKGSGAWPRNLQGFYTIDKFSVTTAFNGEAPNWDFGPQTAAVTDTTVNWDTTDTNITHVYRSWTTGAPTTQYTQSISKTNGVVYNARVSHSWQVGGGTPLVIMGAGTVGLFGSFGTGRVSLPAAATDPATTMALVNALRASAIGFGWNS